MIMEHFGLTEFENVGERWLQGGSDHGGRVSDGATERGGTTDLSCISGAAQVHLSGHPVHPILCKRSFQVDVMSGPERFSKYQEDRASQLE